MYFSAEQFIVKLEISSEQLDEFEQRGIIQGVRKGGHIFYSSRDLYRIKGILLLTERGMSFKEAADRVDHPIQELTIAGNSQ
jgi:DNA-binding transcriptional MerR regulator